MKVILYMAITPNGMIAKENDDTPWSNLEFESYYAFARKFEAIILGRRTYDLMKNAGELNKLGNPLIVVVSRKKKADDKTVAFVSSPSEAISLLNKNAVRKVLVGGGGKLNASFMKEGLIDEICLDVEPMLFGRGIPLFKDETFEKKLSLIGTKKLSKNEIQLRYKVLK